jgi:hypothetical protein
MDPTNTHVLKLRGAFEDVGWHACEAAMAVEEGVLWRGADALRGLGERAAGSRFAYRLDRARWAIQGRVAWPLEDAFRERSKAARVGIGAAAATAAVVSAGSWANLTSNDGPPTAATPVPPPAAAPVLLASPAEEASTGYAITLQGAPVHFRVEQPRSRPVPPASEPTAPTGRVAWRFAQAFVLYEVGRAPEADPAIRKTATAALARSLRKNPPRLPANTRVPRARVLNVVIGERHGNQVQASVSLVRLQAVSELRLTLRRQRDGWRVSEVLG